MEKLIFFIALNDKNKIYPRIAYTPFLSKTTISCIYLSRKTYKCEISTVLIAYYNLVFDYKCICEYLYISSAFLT